MGADKTGYYYELKHPCKNYGFTVFANRKTKFITNNNYDIFTFKEEDFYLRNSIDTTQKKYKVHTIK
jgi:hypothetical protein